MGEGRDARSRIEAAAYRLFAERGIRATGINEILAACGAARATFYSIFGSKDDIARAYLERLYREQELAIDTAVCRRGDGPEALTGVFDVFEVVVGNGRLPGGSLVHVLLELGLAHPVGQASLAYFARRREHLAHLAAQRGIADPVGFARECQLLLKGTLVSAAEGDPDAVEDGRRLAGLLIRHHLASPDAHG
ncbi:TetR/AcrR family transcriptional regulator [Sinomonas atrocyanea]